ncbi:hypothetical protein [Azospirillum sp.]|uniref:hypothetical protein n=1 Tax=Azospirillum sp. TaxID=34012 RepID=UPI002D2F2DC3|nr:hypothetical protein [Azospirillum sp.]HYD69895.1 hypothetical protein [Azospirillum sp.]
MLRTLALSSLLVVGLAGAALAQSANVTGTYTYTGTDTDGSAYKDSGTVVVTNEKSGALSVKWDGGDYVGVGQVTGNVLAVAAVADGKNPIMLMTVNPDGTLSGPWWRRTDPGNKGTEVWKKK